MAERLAGKTIAVLATDGVEQVELTEPIKALKEAGAKVALVAPKSGMIQAFKHFDKADTFRVDAALDSVQPESFDALVLPGGVINPDQLRLEPKAIAFIRHFVEAKKPIAAICHGPWTLIDAGGGGGPPGDLLALAADRSQECRRALERRAGRHRSRARHVPQAGRPAPILRQDDRRNRRGPPRPPRRPGPRRHRRDLTFTSFPARAAGE